MTVAGQASEDVAGQLSKKAEVTDVEQPEVKEGSGLLTGAKVRTARRIIRRPNITINRLDIEGLSRIAADGVVSPSLEHITSWME